MFLGLSLVFQVPPKPFFFFLSPFPPHPCWIPWVKLLPLFGGGPFLLSFRPFRSPPQELLPPSPPLPYLIPTTHSNPCGSFWFRPLGPFSDLPPGKNPYPVIFFFSIKYLSHGATFYFLFFFMFASDVIVGGPSFCSV